MCGEGFAGLAAGMQVLVCENRCELGLTNVNNTTFKNKMQVNLQNELKLMTK